MASSPAASTTPARPPFRAVALVLLIFVLVGILVACIFLVCVYRRFKVLSFYQTWNTLLFEMNPLYRRPPIYNFLFLLKNFLLAIWLASTHNYPNYEVKIGVMVFGQAIVSFSLTLVVTLHDLLQKLGGWHPILYYDFQ